MSEFKVVIFDYDGTLFDTRPAIVHCIERAFAACGRPIPALKAVAGTVNTGLPLQETFFVLDENLRTERAARIFNVTMAALLGGSILLFIW